MQGKDMSSDISISTTQLGSSASMLSIESVDYTHSGTFTCKVSNEAGYVTHTTELKVNGIPLLQVTGKLLIEKVHLLSCDGDGQLKFIIVSFIGATGPFYKSSHPNISH